MRPTDCAIIPEGNIVPVRMVALGRTEFPRQSGISPRRRKFPEMAADWASELPTNIAQPKRSGRWTLCRQALDFSALLLMKKQAFFFVAKETQREEKWIDPK